MRAVVPFLLVLCGVLASDYADRKLPGGLAEADRAALIQHAEESAAAWIQQISLRTEHLLQNSIERGRFDSSRRSARGHRHPHWRRLDQSRHAPEYRENRQVFRRYIYTYGPNRTYRRRENDDNASGPDGTSQAPRLHEPPRRITVTYLVPVEKTADSKLPDRRKRPRRP